jgi:hypothetical protein
MESEEDGFALGGNLGGILFAANDTAMPVGELRAVRAVLENFEDRAVGLELVAGHDEGKDEGRNKKEEV